MMKLMRVIKEENGFEVGDIVRVGVVPPVGKVNPDYEQYVGMYWVCKDKGVVYFNKSSVEDHVLEEVFVDLEEVLKQPIVFTDCGVQDFNDFFISVGENMCDFNWGKSEEFDKRTKLEFFERHYCTDTWVGTGVLSIDGVQVAIFSQTGRKSSCEFIFLSRSAKIKAKLFAKEFIEEVECEYFNDDVLKEGQNLVRFMV